MLRFLLFKNLPMEDTASKSFEWKIFLFGLALGLTLALILLIILNFRSSKNTNSVSIGKKLDLTLSSPKDSFATSEKTLSVIGTSGVKSIVTITTGTENKIVTTSSGGSFSTKLNLTEGKNIIKVTSFDPTNGTSQTQKKEVFYLNEDLSNL